MKTLLEVLNLSSDFLKQKGIPNPKRQSEELIGDALGLKRLELYMDFDRPLTETELELCRKRLARRGQREPNQYIRGEVDFYDCSFVVNRDVLIPRQETEILVDKISQQLAKEDLTGKTLWDVACGSGCIGISLKNKFPMLNVLMSDISLEALYVAKENAKRNEVEVSLIHGDALSPFFGKKTDFIVCNPPYIAESEFERLEPEVMKFEPRLALIGGTTGLEFYQRLVKDLPPFLNPQAKAWFEIGIGQGKAVQDLFSSPIWKRCTVEQDWAGHDRFFFLEIE